MKMKSNNWRTDKWYAHRYEWSAITSTKDSEYSRVPSGVRIDCGNGVDGATLFIPFEDGQLAEFVNTLRGILVEKQLMEEEKKDEK